MPVSLGWSTAPLEPGRILAREWARQELSDPVYARARPGLLHRAVQWVLTKLGEIDFRPSALTNPYAALALLALLVVVVAVVVRLRTGRLRGPSRGPRQDGLFDDAVLSAGQHRLLAEHAAAQGRWADAVRERFRAVVRSLDERALLDDRPGRTADEAAREAGRVLPDLADRLTLAATVFDDVSYGDRPATAEDDERLRALDTAVAGGRLGAGTPR
ncbi:DUF4129 domain-containing protein [Angustibacter sp. McL0619]|uniref:DUF4129 domain-containing protein n=1 Tax=Angustibacter sp. McL0619 TaxID=3415676 RepID=UPI003CF6A75D